MKTAKFEIQSPVGPLYLVASETGLRGVYFKKPAGPFLKSLDGGSPEVRLLAQAAKQLDEYFKGRRQEFDIPLEAEGTDFQKKVWKALSQIPYGKTHSYSDVARKIKNGKAVRAVGTANGRNPLAIIVPCHRVIAADGTLGGYGGGLEIKTRLLEIERR